MARLETAIGRLANILALDEPTEGVDAETARPVLDGLRRTAGRTMILLTRRPDGLAFMDEGVTLDGGKIVQRDKGRQSA
ncbi:hypothetical protein QM467_12175 [Rhodoblastus sp. 17X3]|uniref:hypothetical protein n=1 Tax=Rhodoblastus sp. 17X3 TaxID=3047026 RepID=UPI0024B85A71|nr:hypothetical protein [Rhodoblastus sp. 17X3]MDI9848815.1 hypothetical protein [Rhodoblastus sp. 17X3]